jgi:hypothetical protein
MKVVCLESAGLPVFAASPQAYQGMLEAALNSLEGRVVGVIQKQIGRQMFSFALIIPLPEELP